MNKITFTSEWNYLNHYELTLQLGALEGQRAEIQRRGVLQEEEELLYLPHSCKGDNPYHLYRLFLEDPVVRGVPGVLHEPKDKIKPEIESRFILFRNVCVTKHTFFLTYFS